MILGEVFERCSQHKPIGKSELCVDLLDLQYYVVRGKKFKRWRCHKAEIEEVAFSCHVQGREHQDFREATPVKCLCALT